ncbi:helix-turn-helix domain-containing protein [Sutterella sp.]|uniref:helix-turn-helix domain-containing protein n=1 Tax=Sutterella sp. TaxID=1981025 RepID=UPI0026E01E2A|nr:helix-turn-helix transcriptional regulator [Sutterella sp.]MDO5532508.1 helix-turn-helix transcriptional regulator [Sutterella sp.]
MHQGPDPFHFLQSPKTLQQEVAARMRRLRLDLNYTQEALALRSGVSLGSLRRFESTGEISFRGLVNLLMALNRTEELGSLFAPAPPVNLFAKVPPQRQRASKRKQ